MGNKTMITVGEFDRLEEQEFGYELDEGELITMTRPRATHARIERRLIVALQSYLDRNPVGDVVWVVDAEVRTVEVWTNPEGPIRILSEGDVLEAPELLPGFNLPVARLF